MRLYGIQLVASLMLATVLMTIWGMNHGLSAFAGGLAAIIPQAYVALRTFVSEQKEQTTQQIVTGFYKAEFSKFILTALMFLLAFKLLPHLEFASLFITFILVQAISWIAPLVLKDYWFK